MQSQAHIDYSIYNSIIKTETGIFNQSNKRNSINILKLERAQTVKFDIVSQHDENDLRSVANVKLSFNKINSKIAFETQNKIHE
jgi:hypothetical protein